ncbi:GNAT family N-acetyltransferase [Streptomyces europaeiscabiei]|uniref:GNAT family N-acetyltransferase n=1 Tax=Streptomyces europaeiscabiei TaxID=146819 RepID=UPI0029B47551|nr:GNAT family N-acetyltransferase [Streptomyces europaeiscabiei]MDX3780615.1 GNAT family N-acetyltransferase [Streptomyces europaeiscabiei]
MTSTLHTGPRTTLRAELCTDESEFAELAGPWDRLYRRCGAATPFQSHAWLHSWWLSYGTPGRLRLLLVRDGAELRAVAPLLLVRSPVPALVPLGCPISDFADVIVDDEYADEASDALAEGLSAAARTALIDFREVRPGAAVEQIYDRWRGPRRKVADSVCLELPAQPMDELLKRLPNSRAQRVRAKLRKLGDLGIEPRAVRADEVDSALRTMLDLHRLQWQDRKVTTEHMRPRFSEHLARSVEPMVRSGDAVVTEFRLGGDVLAVDVTLLSRRLAGGYLYGAHPRLRERKADVATMLLNACAGQVSTGSHQVLSLLRGAEPYKLRWRPDTVVNQRLLLARRRTAPLLSAVAYDAAARLRGKELIRRWRARKDPEQNRDRGEQPERKEPGGGGR